MKKILFLFLFVALAISLCACNGSDTDSQITTAETTAAPDETTEFTVEIDPNEKSLNDADFPFDEYVKLIHIESIRVSVPEKMEITDEYVSKWISSALTNLGHFTKDDSKTTVSIGDVVSIDFESMIDGEEYSGGIQNDFCFLIGADAFLPDLENALIGKNVGDTFDVSVKYPDDYSVETLAGKTADFTVTINYLGIPDALDAENVKDISDGVYTTADEYVDYVTEMLKVSAEFSYDNALSEAIWSEITEKTEVIKLPVRDRVDSCEEMIEYITAMSEESGYTYADFLEAQGYTENSFFEFLYNEQSVEIVTEKLIVAAVCAKTGISNTVDDDEYSVEAEKYALYYGYNTVKELEETLGQDTVKELISFSKMTKQLVDKVTVEHN